MKITVLGYQYNKLMPVVKRVHAISGSKTTFIRDIQGHEFINNKLIVEVEGEFDITTKFVDIQENVLMIRTDL